MMRDTEAGHGAHEGSTEEESASLHSGAVTVDHVRQGAAHGAPEVPTTGEPRVDASLALLASLEDLSPAEAANVLGQVHERLHGTLLEP